MSDHRANGQATLSLFSQHLDDLKRSGISDHQILECGFSSESDPKKIRDLLRWERLELAKKLGPCLVIPFFGPDGTPLPYSRLKPDQPRTDNTNGSAGKPIKYESPKGQGNRVFFPPMTRGVVANAGVPLLITEGEKKAAKADQEGFATLGLTGVYGWNMPRPKGPDGKGVGEWELSPDMMAVAWAKRTVYLVFDSDAATNKSVLWAEYNLAKALQKQGAKVKMVRLPPGPVGEDGTPAKVGLDDYLVAKGPEALRALLGAAPPPKKPKKESPEQGQAASGKPIILITTAERSVNDQAVQALAGYGGLYQRGAQLVRICRDTCAPRGVRRPDAPYISALPRSLLQEALADAADWQQRCGENITSAHPPGWCVSAVFARGNWPGVPVLEAVVDHPVLLADGTLLAEDGYHADSGLLIDLRDSAPPIMPERPTKDDAVRARDLLLDIVHDFPFAAPVHRSSWVAGLLTPLAKFAFDGCAPMFLFDANTRGAGKGLLLDTIANIVTGQPMCVATYTNDGDELRKRITALALHGDRLVTFDNLDGRLGCAELDAALTATTWQDRVLGESRMVSVPLLMTWYATGNNVGLGADTSRRVCPIRLETPEERPEERQGFRYPNLLAHVKKHRPRLLGAALTILRAYIGAGMPDMKLSAWGSYEAWSRLVRGAVVWVGLPDPAIGRIEMQDRADDGASAMRSLLETLQQADPDRNGMTAAQMVELGKGQGWPWQADLRDAIEQLANRLDSRILGNRLRLYQRRVFGGVYLARAGTSHNVARWAVYPASDLRKGGSGGSGGSVSPGENLDESATGADGKTTAEFSGSETHPPDPP